MKRMFLGVRAGAMAVPRQAPRWQYPAAHQHRNTSVPTFNCARGTETTTFQAAGIAQSRQLAGQVLDSTAVVVLVRIFVDGQVVFEIPGQVGRPDLWTCTIAEVPGGVGEVFLTPR